MVLGSTKSLPPSRIRHVFVPFGTKVEALVGYERQFCFKSTTAVLAAGKS
jgi:hypothetical protein